jgi:hypothetical protein
MADKLRRRKQENQSRLRPVLAARWNSTRMIGNLRSMTPYATDGRKYDLKFDAEFKLVCKNLD